MIKKFTSFYINWKLKIGNFGIWVVIWLNIKNQRFSAFSFRTSSDFVNLISFMGSLWVSKPKSMQWYSQKIVVFWTNLQYSYILYSLKISDLGNFCWLNVNNVNLQSFWITNLMQISSVQIENVLQISNQSYDKSILLLNFLIFLEILLSISMCFTIWSI